jgi:hydrogenase-4 component B
MIIPITPLGLIAVTSALFCCGMLAPLLRRGGVEISLALALAGSSYALSGAILFVLSPPGVILRASTAWTDTRLPALPWELRIDRLSAFFILLIAAFAAIVAIYSFGALRAKHYQRQRRGIAAAFNLFVWSTLLVVTVNDAFSLIAALELMTLAFGYLTLFKQRLHGAGAPLDDGAAWSARVAPQVYLIISHTSSAFLTMALLILSIHAGSLSFDQLRAGAASLDKTTATSIFILALCGLGMRAGLMPAHFWVPLAHPASPTTTHAFSLGIAIKVAIYLMIRFFFQFLQPQPAWGYMVLLAGAGTALAGVWYAIASHDLKTALAYHSVEHIGIIVAGVGIALIFVAPSAPGVRGLAAWVGTLALIAALYHLVNHAVFKGLLYLCTGAIDQLTGQVVELDRLGGLIKIYPWTATSFLIGALALCGFPPLNGFVSEWLMLQAALASLEALAHDRGQVLSLLMLIASLMLLAASFALTAFCFLKIVGITLLGSPRSSEQARAAWSNRDVPWSMRGMIVLMTAMCLALGILPGLVIWPIAGIAEEILGPRGATLTTAAPQLGHPSTWASLSLTVRPAVSAPPGSGAALPAPELPIAYLLPIFGALWLAIKILSRLSRRKRPLRPRLPWNSGAPYLPVRAQPTSASLSYLIRQGIGDDPESQLDDAPAYLPARLVLSRSEAYPQAVIEIFRAAINRWVGLILRWSEWIGTTMQNGDIRSYLLYIFITAAIVMLIFLVVGG